MKPTYGLVSRYGLVAFASLDQIGPFGRTVEDAAILLGAIAGHDPKDSTSLNVKIPDYTQGLRPDFNGSKLKIGVIKETFGEGLDSVVEQAVNKAIEQLQELGADIHLVSCPRFRSGLPSYYIIAPQKRLLIWHDMTVLSMAYAPQMRKIYYLCTLIPVPLASVQKSNAASW
jgi:aspartyl-tRNA(Asn)/glutamyl-tRNA(Gln) amidotransferase subunit A